MLLLDFQEFATLCGPGTIFSFADPMSPDDRRGLYRKVETLHDSDGNPSDFTYINLLPETEQSGVPYDPELDTYSIQAEPNDIHRWGEYDYDIKYIVFQESDLETLKTALNDAVPCR